MMNLLESYKVIRLHSKIRIFRLYIPALEQEKTYEELIMDEEKDQMQLVYHDKIFVTKPIDMDYENFENNLQKLKKFL